MKWVIHKQLLYQDNMLLQYHNQQLTQQEIQMILELMLQHVEV